MRRAIRARRWLAGIARSTAVLPDFESAHCVDVTTTVVRPVRPLSCVFLRPRQSRRRGVRHDLRFAPPTPPPAGNDGTPYYTEPAHATLSAAGTARRGADESTTRGARSVVGVCPPHGASRRLISTEGTCPHPTHPAPHRPPQDRMWCKSLRQRSWSARQTSGGFPRPQPPRLRPALRRGRQILSPFCRAQVTPQGVITAPAWRISVPGLSPGSAPEPPPTESSYARPQSRLAALMQAGGRGRRAAGGGGSYSPHTTRTPNARCGTCRTSPAWPLLALARPGGAGFVVHHHLHVHVCGPGWRRSCGLGVCGGGSCAPETQHAIASRDAARAVQPPHGLYSRWQGGRALASLFIATSPCTTAALAGGAHAGWGCAGAALERFGVELVPKRRRVRALRPQVALREPPGTTGPWHFG